MPVFSKNQIELTFTILFALIVNPMQATKQQTIITVPEIKITSSIFLSPFDNYIISYLIKFVKM